ncbi:hypothetical protein Ancab_032357 [Ancistrocladus abbreviatus]
MTGDKLVIFLAKRESIDKLVKTFQYASKLVHWHAEATCPELANQAKQWEVASGLSRKAAAAASPASTPPLKSSLHLNIPVLGCSCRCCAYGESFWYGFFVVSDFIVMYKGMRKERVVIGMELMELEEKGMKVPENVRRRKAGRLIRLIALAANVADLIIAVVDIEPNPFYN